MTLRNFKAIVKDTKKGKNAHRAFVRVYIGEVGKPLDPMHTEGWYEAGRPVVVPELGKKVDKEIIKAGLPGGLLINLPKDETQDMQFTFDMFRLATLQLATANNVAIDVRRASTGQTTISSATKTGGTLASATGVGVGEAFLVGTKHATYGGFDEMTIVTSKTGSVVEFEPLSQVPANGAIFEKIAGNTSGTDKDDTGIYIPNAQTLEFPRYQILMEFNLVSSRSLMLVHIPEFEVTEGMIPNYQDPLGRCGFTGNPIIQDEKTFTLLDGTTQSLGWFDETYFIPYEAA